MLLIKPDYNINSIYDIDIQSLEEKGIRAIFFDLDSTVMKSKSGKFSFRTIQFLNDLKSNFKLAILSNNKNKNYIELVKSQIDIPIYDHARKPNTDVFFKVCNDLKLNSKNVAMVGDRPLSDILVGKRAGATTILVDSISKDEENSLVRFVRFLERLSIKR